jgi:hypothetical protein
LTTPSGKRGLRVAEQGYLACLDRGAGSFTSVDVPTHTQKAPCAFPGGAPHRLLAAAHVHPLPGLRRPSLCCSGRHDLHLRRRRRRYHGGVGVGGGGGWGEVCERRRRRCHATRCSRLLERMWIRKAVVLPGSKWPDASTQQASWPWAIATTTTFGCAHTGERYGTQSKRLAWLGRFRAPLSPHVLKLSPLSHTSPCGRRRSTEAREGRATHRRHRRRLPLRGRGCLRV